MKRLIIISGLFLLISVNMPAAGSKNAFKNYVLGSNLKAFTNILKIKPDRGSLVKWDEVKCTFYMPEKSIKIGDFVIPNSNIYLVFYEKKLFRVRILNTFRGYKQRDLAFFSALLAALTQKYGSIKSSEPILTRHSGKYTWKTSTIKVRLIYSHLEYSFTSIERIIRKAVKKGKSIKLSDI